MLSKQGLANTALRTDDAVRIYSVNEIEGATRFVSISGQVKRPGQYELFEENMHVHDLLFKAGGFDDPQYKASVFLDRADLIRYDEDRITQTIIPFHLGQVLANKPTSRATNPSANMHRLADRRSPLNSWSVRALREACLSCL